MPQPLLTLSRVEIGAMLLHIPPKDPEAIVLREKLADGPFKPSAADVETMMLVAELMMNRPLIAKLGRLVLYEHLAAIEHERWAHWQSYMHALCVANADGSLIIPVTYVAQWERQIATPYAGLSEREKDSDREQVDRYWHLIAEKLDESRSDRD